MRWVQLFKTSPSGKTLFVCRGCGRVTPAPTPCTQKPELPEWHHYHGLTCDEIEQREIALFLHPILMNAILRSKMLAEQIKSKGVQTAQQLVRGDRKAVADTIILAASRVLSSSPAQDRWRVWDALDAARQEILKK